MNRRILLGISIVSLALFVYKGVIRLALLPVITLPDLPGGISFSTLLLMVFSLTHSMYALGWRHSLVFFGLSAVISWMYEQVGVATGAIYGPYHYTDYLGAKLGHVPFLIPIAWFMMIYPSYVLTNLIVDGQPAGSHGGMGRVAWLSFVTAMVMTVWDLVVDPLLSGPSIRAWIWEQGGPYFGVPVQNYIGWLLTTFTVYLIYRLFERRFNPRPIGSMTVSITAMTLIAYGAMMYSNVASGNVPEMIVIAPFVMGLPLVMSAIRLLTRQARPA